MKVLVACEFSGIVRDAFASKGHDAWSCDILPTERPRNSNHIQGDVLAILNDGWDLMIAHPPCTHLAVSGARWFKDKLAEQSEALEFVRALMEAPINKIAIENPVSIISSRIRKPDQIIQPWMFGHKSRKATCLWLKNLQKIKPTEIVSPELYTDCRGRTYSRDFLFDSSGKWTKFGGQGHRRSRTYEGIAQAMADQWG